MDAIRKKMQSLKGETDGLYATIGGFEDDARESAARADQVTRPHKYKETKIPIVYQYCLFSFFNYFCAG